MIKRKIESIDQSRSYMRFDRPIFILAAPRSGSTFLFDLICRFEEVWAWHSETDRVWQRLFPHEPPGEPSDFIGLDRWTPRIGSRLRRELYRRALWARQEQGIACSLKDRVGWTRIRYLEKTIANCFHVEFLCKVFPDARFIMLIRDGRATISSMMAGWGEQRFSKDHLSPYIQQLHIDNATWSYPAPPGWSKLLGRPLEEICAWSWIQHVETAASGIRSIPADRILKIHYEDLITDTASIAERIGEFGSLNWNRHVTDFVNSRPLSRTTVSAPRADKWQELHGDRIAQVLPMIRGTMRSFGYVI